MRPTRLIVILGTATDVGKTWIIAHLAAELATLGMAVTARKPVQSHSSDDAITDADILAAATGECVSDLCPAHRSYPLAMAPPMAADVLGRPPFTIEDLVSEIAWPHLPTAVGLVETVGGPLSPLATDGDSVDLAAALHPDLLILVADAGLGAINAVRLAAAACAAIAAPLVVMLNRFDPADDLHGRNRSQLATDGFDLVINVADLIDRLTP
ncbi:MAG: ATP-dependent dethiobiotin synthetase BioD [Pseudonocardiaceae bacterium]